MCIHVGMKQAYKMTISEQAPYGTQRKYDAFGGKKKQKNKKQLHSKMEKFQDECDNSI